MSENDLKSNDLEVPNPRFDKPRKLSYVLTSREEENILETEERNPDIVAPDEIIQLQPQVDQLLLDAKEVTVEDTFEPSYSDSESEKHSDHHLTQAEESHSWYHIDKHRLKTGLKHIFPILHWLPKYKTEYRTPDIAAGLSIGSMVIPQAIAYSTIAGVTPNIGLNTAFISLLIYPLFATSHHLTIGSASISSIMVFGALSPDFDEGTDDYIAAANTLAFFIGIFFTLAAYLNLGFIASFLTYPVVIGFAGGCSLTIGSSQLKNAFGIEGKKGTFITNMRNLFENIGDTSGKTLVFCLICLLVLQICKRTPQYWDTYYTRRIKYIPMALVLVIVGTLISYGTDKGGGETVGNVDISFSAPQFYFGDKTVNLIINGLILVIIIFTEHTATAINYGMKHEYDIIANQELYGHGVCNLIGCLVGVYPCAGVITHAPLIDDANAQTPIFCWIAAGVLFPVIIMLSAKSDVLAYLPTAVLAAIVLNACICMFPYHKMVKIWHVDTRDTYLLVVTFLATLGLGIVQGIMIGFVLSLLFLVYRASKPHCAILGRLPGTVMYRSITAYPDAVTTKGIIVFRLDGPLFFGNAKFFKTAIQIIIERSHRSHQLLNYFIFDCHGISDIDVSGVTALDQVFKMLDRSHIMLLLAGVKYPVLKHLLRSHLLELIGAHLFFESVHHARMFLHNCSETIHKDHHSEKRLSMQELRRVSSTSESSQTALIRESQKSFRVNKRGFAMFRSNSTKDSMRDSIVSKTQNSPDKSGVELIPIHDDVDKIIENENESESDNEIEGANDHNETDGLKEK